MGEAALRAIVLLALTNTTEIVLGSSVTVLCGPSRRHMMFLYVKAADAKVHSRSQLTC